MTAARTKRITPATVAMVSVATGRTRNSTRSSSPASLPGMPPAGNQPRITAKRMISRMASQNGGSEMPAKADRLIEVSVSVRGRSAATIPAGRASATARAKLRPIRITVFHRRGSRTSSTGRACRRE